ncbi:MAG: type IV toxin-antitoxin system AbiEi family antitoxin domain-containing protein [Acidimicrobiales bacterium]
MSDTRVDIRASDLPDELIARGQHWINLPEVAELLHVPQGQVPPLMARLRKKGQVFSPTRGAYVPIPPEYRSWGAVPATHFVDRLMAALDHPYYVGFLSAAEVHGAAHQRPQVFQVVTTARVRDRSFGRVALEFIKDVRAADRPVDISNTPTGTMRVATPEVTVLDLVASPKHGGGLSNVATVAADLVSSGHLDFRKLTRAATTYPLAVVQRTGWLSDHVARHLGTEIETDSLMTIARRRSEPTPLDAGGPRSGELDARWNVLVNTDVEPDL